VLSLFSLDIRSQTETGDLPATAPGNFEFAKGVNQNRDERKHQNNRPQVLHDPVGYVSGIGGNIGPYIEWTALIFIDLLHRFASSVNYVLSIPMVHVGFLIDGSALQISW
jgi:hypothetical protein